MHDGLWGFGFRPVDVGCGLRLNERQGGYREGAGAKARQFTDKELARIRDMRRCECSCKAIAARFGTSAKRIAEVLEQSPEGMGE